MEIFSSSPLCWWVRARQTNDGQHEWMNASVYLFSSGLNRLIVTVGIFNITTIFVYALQNCFIHQESERGSERKIPSQSIVKLSFVNVRKQLCQFRDLIELSLDMLMYAKLRTQLENLHALRNSSQNVYVSFRIPNPIFQKLIIRLAILPLDFKMVCTSQRKQKGNISIFTEQHSNQIRLLFKSLC